MFILSLALVGLKQEAIVVQGLSLKKAHIIIVWILSKLFNDFKVQGLRSIPTTLMMLLMEYFHADAKTIIH